MIYMYEAIWHIIQYFQWPMATNCNLPTTSKFCRITEWVWNSFVVVKIEGLLLDTKNSTCVGDRRRAAQLLVKHSLFQDILCPYRTAWGVSNIFMHARIYTFATVQGDSNIRAHYCRDFSIRVVDYWSMHWGSQVPIIITISLRPWSHFKLNGSTLNALTHYRWLWKLVWN